MTLIVSSTSACVSCGKRFKEDKSIGVLPCGHVACRKCLETKRDGDCPWRRCGRAYRREQVSTLKCQIEHRSLSTSSVSSQSAMSSSSSQMPSGSHSPYPLGSGYSVQSTSSLHSRSHYAYPAPGSTARSTLDLHASVPSQSHSQYPAGHPAAMLSTSSLAPQSPGMNISAYRDAWSAPPANHAASPSQSLSSSHSLQSYGSYSSGYAASSSSPGSASSSRHSSRTAPDFARLHQIAHPPPPNGLEKPKGGILRRIGKKLFKKDDEDSGEETAVPQSRPYGLAPLAHASTSRVSTENTRRHYGGF